MIGIVLVVYGEMLNHYEKKWKNERIDDKYESWIKSQEMREEMGFDNSTFKHIPKRKIKNNAARKRHAGRNS